MGKTRGYRSQGEDIVDRNGRSGPSESAGRPEFVTDSGEPCAEVGEAEPWVGVELPILVDREMDEHDSRGTFIAFQEVAASFGGDTDDEDDSASTTETKQFVRQLHGEYKQALATGAEGLNRKEIPVDALSVLHWMQEAECGREAWDGVPKDFQYTCAGMAADARLEGVRREVINYSERPVESDYPDHQYGWNCLDESAVATAGIVPSVAFGPPEGVYGLLDSSVRLADAVLKFSSDRWWLSSGAVGRDYGGWRELLEFLECHVDEDARRYDTEEIARNMGAVNAELKELQRRGVAVSARGVARFHTSQLVFQLARTQRWDERLVAARLGVEGQLVRVILSSDDYSNRLNLIVIWCMVVKPLLERKGPCNAVKSIAARVRQLRDSDFRLEPTPKQSLLARVYEVTSMAAQVNVVMSNILRDMLVSRLAFADICYDVSYGDVFQLARTY